MNTRKRRGAETERVLAEYLRGHGFPFAEPAGAGRGGTDISGTPGLVWEAKARRQINLPDHLRQAVRHKRHDSDLPVLVLRLDGQGPASVADWPAVVPLHVFVHLLTESGYTA